MRSKGLIVFFALAVVGCDSGLPVAAAGASQDCVRIVSAMERLACFDAQAGTPPILHEPRAEENVVATTPEPAPEPEIIALMRRAEAGRIQGHVHMALEAKLPVHVGFAVADQDEFGHALYSSIGSIIPSRTRCRMRTNPRTLPFCTWPP